jgi:hypothetical protein
VDAQLVLWLAAALPATSEAQPYLMALGPAANNPSDSPTNDSRPRLGSRPAQQECKDVRMAALASRTSGRVNPTEEIDDA